MKLLGIMQGVSLTGEIQNYLDFERNNGTKFQLPVPEECVKLLLDEIYAKKPAATQVEHIPEPEPEEALPDGATTFGGEEPGPEPLPEDDGAPQSEAEVPSL